MPTIKNLKTGQTHTINQDVWEGLWKKRVMLEPESYQVVLPQSVNFSSVDADIDVEAKFDIPAALRAKADEVRTQKQIDMFEATQVEEEDEELVNDKFLSKPSSVMSSPVVTTKTIVSTKPLTVPDNVVAPKNKVGRPAKG